jgi:thioredoxin reductase/NAD-dependent dihydropyrimidine dehydrogenase PreA subunit
MSQTLFLVLLAAAALAAFGAWAWIDHRRAAASSRIAADIATLGDDLVPVSLHPVVDASRCIGSGACVRACPETDVIGLVGGHARLLNPLACIGHGACMAACPVHAISLVFGTAARGVELPSIGEDFQTPQPGIYVVGELGGMGLIRNAVEQGRQAAEAIVASGRRGVAGALDAVVVGAGPAGISATLSLRQAGWRVALLEQSEYGGTITHYPRAKVVMTGSFELPGFGRVARRTMSKEELLALWEDLRVRTDLPVETGVKVEGVVPDPLGGWQVTCAGARPRRAATVVLALGRRGTPRRLGVPGEELAKVSYRLLEPEPFAGEHVLIVGGGNAAADCALALADAGTCASLTLSYRRAELVRLRATVRASLDAAIGSGRVRVMLPSEVVSIAPHEVVLRGPDGEQTLANDAVIVQIGGTAPDEVLRQSGIPMVEKRGVA